MISHTLKALFSLFIVLNMGCAETPNSPLAEGATLEQKVSGSDIDAEEIQLLSVVFTGVEFVSGDQCVIYLSILEEHADEHDHSIVAKLGYQVHGETPIDTVMDFQMYDASTRTYHPEESDLSGTYPILASVVLDDQDEEIDYNNMQEYRDEGHLVQSLVLEFPETDVESLEKSLEDALSGEKQMASENALEQLRKLSFTTYHNGHYDSVGCIDFKYTGLETTTFAVGVEYEDDHDEDHDHNHDEDEDDHGGDDDDHDHDHDHNH